MLKAICRFLSDACWRIGAENLSMWFLLRSLQTTRTVKPVIRVNNTPPVEIPIGPFDVEVMWEDKPLIEELGKRRDNDICIARHVHDIN